jgi:hypothetical protein
METGSQAGHSGIYMFEPTHVLRLIPIARSQSGGRHSRAYQVTLNVTSGQKVGGAVDGLLLGGNGNETLP